ncbi:MAG: TM2 domain-containing protein [Gemmiger sp.]|uniref:TM2 domain-containing protein n=1 Tax=Gemmiger sp. TaxID=2049027 RepID=UPI002E79EE89|nr:TM2 domain-containing protein [Gemmiger sp.]MEE0709941.1 TM2 domain-containing protein [Gemmiger sp.]
MSPSVEFWVTLLFGAFGIHKFLQGKIGMGLLYFFTCGLFCFGWIYDTVQAGRRYFGAARYAHELRSKPTSLSAVPAPGLFLDEGEVCVYCSPAQYTVTKNRVTGYVREGGGASVRIMPGLSVGRSTGVSRAIRENVSELYPGTLYITNHRIVFSGNHGSFDKKLNALTTFAVNPKGIELQFGSSFYELLVQNAARCINTLEGVLNKIPIE